MTATPTPAPPQNKAMVRGLLIAIGIMSTAIVVLFAAIVAKLLNPEEEQAAAAPAAEPGTIDFAAAPLVEIGLPPGARVVETHVSADRATFVYETVHGEKGVFTTPLTGYDEPVRFVFHTLE